MKYQNSLTSLYFQNTRQLYIPKPGQLQMRIDYCKQPIMKLCMSYTALAKNETALIKIQETLKNSDEAFPLQFLRLCYFTKVEL